jgi:hypothetical protein
MIKEDEIRWMIDMNQGDVINAFNTLDDIDMISYTQQLYHYQSLQNVQHYYLSLLPQRCHYDLIHDVKSLNMIPMPTVLSLEWLIDTIRNQERPKFIEPYEVNITSRLNSS